jgi:hypothetical protein
LKHRGVTVLLVVSVEEHLAARGAVFDWESPLREYDRHRGLLMVDDAAE